MGLLAAGTKKVLQAAGLAADRIKCLEVHGSDAECVQAVITGQTPRQASKVSYGANHFFVL